VRFMSTKPCSYKQDEKTLKKRKWEISILEISIPISFTIICVYIFSLEISTIGFDPEFLIVTILFLLVCFLFMIIYVRGFRKLMGLSPLQITKDTISLPLEPSLLGTYRHNHIGLPIEEVPLIKIRKRPFPFNDAFFEVCFEEPIKGKTKYQMRIQEYEINEITSALDEQGIVYEVTGLYG